MLLRGCDAQGGAVTGGEGTVVVVVQEEAEIPALGRHVFEAGLCVPAGAAQACRHVSVGSVQASVLDRAFQECRERGAEEQVQVAYCGEVLHVLQSTAQSVGEDGGPAEYAVGIQVLTGIYKVKIDSPPVAAVGLAQLDDPQVFPDRLGAVGGRPAEFQGIVQEVAVPVEGVQERSPG